MNEEIKIKQVIVVRKDLKMRKGKIAAQSAHASFAVFRNEMTKQILPGGMNRYLFEVGDIQASWLDNEFTKICVSVDSEEELLEIHRLAEASNLPNALITDAGHTEFHGVPTKTCCAIGPARGDKIDKITGGLSLL